MSSRTPGHVVERLTSYNQSSFPILSVYFPLIRSSQNNAKLSQKFTELVKKHLTPTQQATMTKQIAYIQGFLETYKTEKNDISLAFFTGDEKLFEILHLPYLTDTIVTVSHSPNLTPFLREEQPYRKFGILLADREKARFFLLSNGAVEKTYMLLDESVPHHVHEKASESLHNDREAKIDRHIRLHFHRHLQRIAKGFIQFVGSTTLDGIIIGGHKQMHKQIEQHLPKNLQEKIIHEFTTTVDIDETKLAHALNVLTKEFDTMLANGRSPYLFVS